MKNLLNKKNVLFQQRHTFLFLITVMLSICSIAQTVVTPPTDTDVELIETIHGFSVYVQKKDGVVSSYLREKKTWQPDIVYVLTQLIKPGNKVVHLGGHIGFDDIIIGRLIGDTGVLHAFEPNPETFKILQMNLSHNNLTKTCLAYNLGAWSESGEKELYFSYTNTGHATLNSNENGLTQHTRVKLIKLDDFLKDLEEIDLLFMDTEGAEINAIQGAQRILKNSPNCKIIMEWDIGMLKGMNADIEGFLKSQKDQKIRIYKININNVWSTNWDDGGLASLLTPCTTDDLLNVAHMDIIFSKTPLLGEDIQQ